MKKALKLIVTLNYLNMYGAMLKFFLLKNQKPIHLKNSSNFKMQFLKLNAVLLIVLINCTVSFCQISDTVKTAVVDSTQTSRPDEFVYTKPRPFAFVTKLPKTMAWSAKESFSKKSIPAWGIITSSTLVLIACDQDITDGVKRFSRYIGLDNENKYKTVVGFNVGSTHFDAYQLPQNLNSVFYSLGEGSTSLLLCGGMSLYGIAYKDNRARQTSSQILQAQLALGITCQILKRVAGRESPAASTAPGGVWRPFTKPSEYQKAVSHHDAFPSGHLATMMATVTVLAGNYPEKRWIIPVGYSVIGVTGLAMINNGVHWAGDYPLALGIGYICGKMAVKMNKLMTAKAKRK